MSKEIVIKRKNAKSKIEIMKKIQMKIAAMEEQDIEVFFCESSGESVDKIKELLKETYALKNMVSNHMENVVNQIENYVNSHIELDKNMSQIIEEDKGDKQKWKK